MWTPKTQQCGRRSGTTVRQFSPPWKMFFMSLFHENSSYLLVIQSFIGIFFSPVRDESQFPEEMKDAVSKVSRSSLVLHTRVIIERGIRNEVYLTVLAKGYKQSWASRAPRNKPAHIHPHICVEKNFNPLMTIFFG